MIDENKFDYETYIQEHLREIDDLDERKFAKKLLLESLEKIFSWTEKKYDELQQRVYNELKMTWEKFGIYTTVIDKKNYDALNNFWFPMCEEDIHIAVCQTNTVIYLMADDEACRQFFCQETIMGIEQESGKEICFKIEKAQKYQKQISKLHKLFLNNHIPWQTIHMGHLERFFEVCPIEEIASDTHITFQWGEWDKYIKTEKIPLWNVQKTSLHSREFRLPCIDEIVYEHIFHLKDRKAGQDGYLVETEEDILSVRYEENKLLLKTEKESVDNVVIYRLHQSGRMASYGYQYPVLTNRKEDSFSARYLNEVGNFIQTPMELRRKIEEMSGNYEIRVMNYEIIDCVDEKTISGDMNELFDMEIFPDDRRKILLFYIERDREKEDYLYHSQIRYILSQLQMEFLEYRCMGKFV